MKNEYKLWLEKHGYAYFTANARPSTIYDYMRGLKRVCREEKLSVEGVAKRIDSLVSTYQRYGKKSNIGRTISRSVRSSLVQFGKFVKEREVA
ncbi:MAG: hypothetical protein FWF97_04070 [Alphaproteobacteria bacterium]|nr:hypothetical protein [Alphaproteobacteria bacterium]